MEQRGPTATITINESLEEWLDRKWALAEKVVDDWQKNKIPILVVVEQDTANTFNCYLSDCIQNISKDRGIRPQIHLAQPFENGLIENFEAKHKVVREFDEWLKSSKSTTVTN